MYKQCLLPNLLTNGGVKKVIACAGHGVKRDGSVVLLTQSSACELGGNKGRFVRLTLEYCQLLHRNKGFLQADGSLFLHCHITMALGAAGAVSGPANWSKLRQTGVDSDFVILSPGGKEFKVADD